MAADEGTVSEIANYAPLFEGLGASQITKGWGGADISPLMATGVLGMGMRPDGSHYFDLHRSPADTVEKIDPADLERNAGAMALMAWILAERLATQLERALGVRARRLVLREVRAEGLEHGRLGRVVVRRLGELDGLLLQGDGRGHVARRGPDVAPRARSPGGMYH